MPYAVAINEASLDLIAGSNGGLAPKIEPGPKGHPGTYFVLPDNPNDHAEILDMEKFFEAYEFIGPEALDEFRPIRHIRKDANGLKVLQEYSISRNLLARMVAAHRSGMFNAIPEQDDFGIADEMIEVMERQLAY